MKYFNEKNANANLNPNLALAASLLETTRRKAGLK